MTGYKRNPLAKYTTFEVPVHMTPAQRQYMVDNPQCIIFGFDQVGGLLVGTFDHPQDIDDLGGIWLDAEANEWYSGDDCEFPESEDQQTLTKFVRKENTITEAVSPE